MITIYRNFDRLSEVDHPYMVPIIALEHDIPMEELSVNASDLAAYEAKQRITKIRAEIEPVAGDTQSIQGTIADNVGLIMEKLGRLAIAHGQGDAAFNAAMADLAAVYAPLLADIDDGSCIMTHHVKGEANVVTEGGARAHAVAGVLIDNAGD